MKSKVVEALYNAGVDAQTNLFYADFDLSDGDITAGLAASKTSADDAAKRMTVRLEGFTPPEMKQDTYTNFFGTAWIDVPKAFADVNRSFNLKFRVDNTYTIYKQLCLIQKLNMNAPTAGIGNSPSYFNVDIKTLVGPIDGTKNYKSTDFKTIYHFDKCWIKKLSAPEFKTGDAGVVTVEATIGFFDIEDYHTGKLV